MTYLNLVVDSVLKLLETLHFDAVGYYLKYCLYLDFRTPYIPLLINFSFCSLFLLLRIKLKSTNLSF